MIAEHLRTVARARTASTSGRWMTAASLWERVVESNPVNGDYWERLADARFAVDDYGAALAAYEKVLELGTRPHRDLVFPADVEYRVACCHARLGHPERAKDALARAMRLGLRDFEQAWTDERLESLRSDPWFSETFGPAGVDGGWRADLRLLAREVRRRSYSIVRLLGEQQFNDAVEELDRAIPRLTDVQIIVELTKLLRPLGDGHAYIDLPDDATELRRALPLQFFLFEEGLFVIAAEPAHRQLLGARVLRFDKHSVDDALAELDPLIARDNEHGPKQQAPMWLRRLPFLHALGITADPGKATLTVQLPDESITEVTVVAEATHTPLIGEFPSPPGWVFLPETLPTPMPLYLRSPGAFYWFDHLPDARLVYFQFNGVGDDPAESPDAFYRRLFEFIDDHDADKLVIDLRWNSGGNTFFTLPLLHRIIGSRRINRRGHLFVIIGRKTFSAAQNFTTFLERHTNAIFVGEPTGSSPNFVGESTPFVLPHSKLEVNVSDLYWQTSWPMDTRCWLAPELYAPPTFAAFRENRDPAMEAILACREHLPGW
jgi:tetratricopeptide (TPR) repeat protein